MNIVLTPHQENKKKKGLCIATRCSTCRAKNRNFCHRHVKINWAKDNPEKHVFDQRKANALKKGKSWELTFQQFLKFLKKNPDYMTKRGRKVKCLSIDRHENHLGYTEENIRSVSVGYNSWKRNHIDYQTTDPTAENYCGF